MERIWCRKTEHDSIMYRIYRHISHIEYRWNMTSIENMYVYVYIMCILCIYIYTNVVCVYVCVCVCVCVYVCVRDV